MGTVGRDSVAGDSVGWDSVVWDSDPAYSELRSALCWNARVPDRYPRAIARAASRVEVAEVVRLARAGGLKVSARSSGHNFCVAALRSGGVLLDVSALDTISVDRAASRVSVGPGVTGERLVGELAQHGLTFPVGHCPGVALGGYLLGGGAGWNFGSVGPACASVRGVELVDAGAEVLAAGGGHNEDLLWAARGGGPGFPGIITRYDLQAYPLARFIARTEWIVPLALLDEVAGWVSAVAELLPAAVEVFFYAGSVRPGAPPGAMAEDHNARVILLRGIAFADTEAQARSMLAPLADPPFAGHGVKIADVARQTMRQLMAASGAMHPDGHRYAVDQLWLAGKPGTGLGAVAAHLAAAPSPRSHALFFVTSNADNDSAGMDLAFSRTDNWYVLLSAIWRDRTRDAVNVRWLEELVAMLEPSATGYYVNETDLFASPQRASNCFTTQHWRRLQDVKRSRDPDDVFASHPRSEDLR